VTGPKDALYAEFAEFGKALASPKRLELLDLLAQGPRGVDDLAAAADIGISSCSAHLRTLREVGLAATRRDGIYYSLASFWSEYAPCLPGFVAGRAAADELAVEAIRQGLINGLTTLFDQDRIRSRPSNWSPQAALVELSDAELYLSESAEQGAVLGGQHIVEGDVLLPDEPGSW
jgi:DNA-binding transcriptional ArsR family regulator